MGSRFSVYMRFLSVLRAARSSSTSERTRKAISHTGSSYSVVRSATSPNSSGLKVEPT